MKILGIDPSLSYTGFAVIEDNGELVEFGKLITGPTMKEEDRICKTTNRLKKIIENYKIEKVVMETQHFRKSPKVTMQLSRLRGAITYMCRMLDCELFYFAPTEARKLFFGNGAAKKLDIANFIRENIVDLGEFDDTSRKSKNSDMYDAIAIGIAFINKNN